MGMRAHIPMCVYVHTHVSVHVSGARQWVNVYSESVSPELLMGAFPALLHSRERWEGEGEALPPCASRCVGSLTCTCASVRARV